MIAAIYARKSTGQHVADDAKSVTRQVDNAKAFAIQQGWTVDDQFIFKDDGVSGADARRLHARQRMIDAASKRQFQVVIMQAQDRFSRRDGDEAFAELKALSKHVEIWFYADHQQFTHGNLASNVTGFLKAEFAAEFRRAIAQKTHEAMRRRAEQGHVTGGKVFGYTNVRANGHVDRVINDSEAIVIRAIYQQYAAGDGFKAIAHALNAKHLPSPRPQRGRPAGWEPSTVRAVLKRSLYRGTIIYDRTKKRDADGSRHKGRQPKKPLDQVLTVDAPHLRIVDLELIDTVDERLNVRRHAYLRDGKGRLLGSPRRHGHGQPKHLLAGFIICECGATFEAVRGYYICSARRRKGPAICKSPFSFPVETIDHVFLDSLQETMLSPRFIDRLLDATFAHDPNAEHQAMLAERQRLATEITNLTAVAAAGSGDISALAAALSDRDKRLKVLDLKLAKPVTIPDRDVLKAALELRTADWRDILRGPHVAQARVVLQHLVDLPIRVHNQPVPEFIKKSVDRHKRTGRWSTHTRPDGLLVGLIQSVASPTGFETSGP